MTEKITMSLIISWN